MRIETLPSPGLLSNGIKLRVEAAKAISALEVTAARQGGTTEGATQLAAFFTACAAALAAITPAAIPPG